MFGRLSLLEWVLFGVEVGKRLVNFGVKDKVWLSQWMKRDVLRWSSWVWEDGSIEGMGLSSAGGEENCHY